MTHAPVEIGVVLLRRSQNGRLTTTNVCKESNEKARKQWSCGGGTFADDIIILARIGTSSGQQNTKKDVGTPLEEFSFTATNLRHESRHNRCITKAIFRRQNASTQLLRCNVRPRDATEVLLDGDLLAAFQLHRFPRQRQ